MTQLLKTAIREFIRDECPTRAAALAYYALFAVPPLVMISILVAGRIWGAEAAQENLRAQLSRIVDPWGADLVMSTLQAGQNEKRSLLASVVSGAVLMVGASGVMLQLQSALNHVWNSEAVPQLSRSRSLLVKRLLCFLMVLAVALLLLASLIATAVLAAMVNRLDSYLPNESGAGLRHLGNSVITFMLIVVLLAMLFRWMPDTEVQWRDVWGGAVVTAMLFVIGKELLGWYLGTVHLRGYGGAGALVLLLMWIYYSSLILLFGAELTQAWAQGRGGGKRR